MSTSRSNFKFSLISGHVLTWNVARQLVLASKAYNFNYFRLTLRKVCTFFRDTIDSKAYGFKIIEFHLLFDWVMLVLDKEIFKYASREQHGCWVSNGLNEHHFQEEYFLKLAIDDLAVILKDQSQKLDLLEVCVCDRATKRSRDYFFPALLKMLVTVDYRKIEKFDGDFPEIWDIWKKYQDTVLSSNK